jgi:hypothetical protein
MEKRVRAREDSRVWEDMEAVSYVGYQLIILLEYEKLKTNRSSYMMSIFVIFIRFYQFSE